MTEALVQVSRRLTNTIRYKMLAQHCAAVGQGAKDT